MSQHRTTTARRVQLVLAATTASCAAPELVPTVHFPNAPAVTIVDDRRDVPKLPEVTPYYNRVDFYQRSIAEPPLRVLSLRNHTRALGVNALDEVPDSTWFTNRVGVRDLTPDEVRAGPIAADGPEAHTPWTIHSTKPGGVEAGYVITDARGIKFLIKFDQPDLPELMTGAQVVVNRLVWACGYNVPEDSVAFVRPSDLVLAPDAEIVDWLGHPSQRLDRWRIDHDLAKVPRAPDGRFRVMASRWLSGKSLGGAVIEGVRGGDPNDRIAHERRRDLRGQYTVFAWLDHIDVNAGNALDMWITDPHDPRRHYVEHYTIDFSKSLRVFASTDRFPQESHAYIFDYGDIFRSLFTLGFAPRPWGHSFAPALTGVAPAFVADDFDPGAWRSDIPYAPYVDADRFDMFWGARLVARFTRDQIHAAVEAGRFSDPRAVEYITDTLVARQRKTEAYWFSRVNPLDHFAVGDDGVCFDDLAIGARLASAASTRYDVTSFDAGMHPLGRVAVAAAASGPTCTPALAKSAIGDGYTIVRVATSRPGFTGETYVHLAKDPNGGAWRVIGIWRT